MSKPRRVILSGYYGYGNVGDDAILLALSEQLTAWGVESVLVPAGPHRERLGRPAGVTFLERRDWRAIRAALRDGAAVVSGGGGLFQDATSLRSLGYYLAVLELARRARRPYLICAQSLGPLRRGLSRRLTARALRGAAGISLRDRRSAATAAELGLPADRLKVIADPAFALTPPEPMPAGRPTIGLCLRPTPHLERVVAAVGEWLPDRPPEAEILAVACQERDVAVHQRVLAGTESSVGPLPVAETMAALAGCELVVAERLHALIFAVAAGVPCLAIDYDPKVAGLAADLSLPLAGRDATLTATELTAAVARAWSGRAAERERLRPLAEAARATVRDGLRTVFECLASPDSP